MLKIVAIGILLSTIALLVFAVVYPRLTARRVRSFKTRVVDKYKRNSMIYTGVFIPIVLKCIEVEMGVEINVRDSEYRSVEVGDTVWVSKYSNGSYRLER